MAETNLDKILGVFLQTNQGAWTQLEQLGLTIDCVEVIMIPTERRIVCRIKEFEKHGLKTHEGEKSLTMRGVDFDEHVRKTSTPNITLRHQNMRDLTPEIVDGLLENHKPPEET